MSVRAVPSLLAIHVSVSAAFRVDHKAQMRAPEPPSVSVMDDRVSIAASTDEVDFSFMTHGDFSRPNTEENFGTWLHKIFGRDRQNLGNVKEEIANQHFCNANGGADDQTYYASSFCYWLPEIRKDDAPAADIGLTWEDGRDIHRKPLCGSLAGEGKCMKCTACHNNGMDADATVNFKSQAEDLTPWLSSSCLKEKEIEQRCLSKYVAENPVLHNDSVTCQQWKDEFEKAESDYQKTVEEIATLENLLAGIPARITELTTTIETESVTITQSDEDAWVSRRKAVTDCEDFGLHYGFSQWFYDLDQTDVTTEDLMTRFVLSVCTPGSSAFYACRRCTVVHTEISDAMTTKAAAVAKKDAAQQEKGDLEQQSQESSALKKELEDNVLPGQQVARDESTEIWETNKDHCNRQIQEFQDKRLEYVRDCAPTMYSDSCEKQCLELQHVFAGCGVVEGSRVDDGTSRGGVQLSCKPPQPSWIMKPWTYGGERESQRSQCSRLARGQQKRVSQRVLKSGWMQKKGRWWGRKDRFFFLDSGDQVHSGVLYYYESNPADVVGQIPRYEKKVILWDAKSVYPVGGWSHCLKVNHFYRNYDYCVTDRASRDDWVKHIEAEIVRPRPDRQ